MRIQLFSLHDRCVRPSVSVEQVGRDDHGLRRLFIFRVNVRLQGIMVEQIYGAVVPERRDRVTDIRRSVTICSSV